MPSSGGVHLWSEGIAGTFAAMSADGPRAEPAADGPRPADAKRRIGCV